MKEINLTKISLYQGKIPSLLSNKIDFDNLRKNFILNRSVDNFQSENVASYYSNYLNFQDHKHVMWIYDYIRDFIKFEHKIKILMREKSAIVQYFNESVGLHNHMDDNNLHQSPDYSVIYTIESGEIPSYIIFKYGDKLKDRYCKLELKRNNFIVFPSYLNHSLSKNMNQSPLIHLSIRLEQPESS